MLGRAEEVLQRDSSIFLRKEGATSEGQDLFRRETRSKRITPYGDDLLRIVEG